VTDRELIERAARAAGILIEYNWHFFDVTDPSDHKIWNPLTNDGDALRLAVKLGLQVTLYDGAVSAGIPGEGEQQEEIDDVDYAYPATRRAIVRAAAAFVRAAQPKDAV
jgi:hypothetical protein